MKRFAIVSHYPMPSMCNGLTGISGSKYFVIVDIFHSYLQFPLHDDSCEYQSFLNLDGMYTPMRVIYRPANAVAYLQSSFTSATSP